jgi:membrane-bound lytic murein transglycosylase MltF
VDYQKKVQKTKFPNFSIKSNKNIVKNALMHVCLAGSLNKEIKEEVLLVC